MKVIITGANGTLGSVLKKFLENRKVEVVTWNREIVPIEDRNAMEKFLNITQPDILFHLAIGSQSTGKPNESWLVNVEWTSELARLTNSLKIKFIYTSTAMVFSDDAKGPFTIDSRPDAKEGYGYEKRISEEMVFEGNSSAIIARLGWQIGENPGSNNMIDYFDKHMRQNGQIGASRKWYPACSFLIDTAEALFDVSEFAPGLYMLDSNEKWNFFEIASALNNLYGNPWKIAPIDDFVYDQRLLDKRILINSLKKTLKGLK